MTRRSDKDEKRVPAAAAPVLSVDKKREFLLKIAAVELPAGATRIHPEWFSDSQLAQRAASRSQSKPPIYNETPTDSDNSQATQVLEWDNEQQPAAAAAVSAAAASPSTPILANTDWDGESTTDVDTETDGTSMDDDDATDARPSAAAAASPSTPTTDGDTEADDDADFAEHTANLFAPKTGAVAVAADAKAAPARAYRTVSAVTAYSFTAHMAAAPAARAASSGNYQQKKDGSAGNQTMATSLFRFKSSF